MINKHQNASERRYLGCVLIDNSVLRMNRAEQADFTCPLNAKCFKIICDMVSESGGRPVDTAYLCERILSGHRDVDSTGLRAHLPIILDYVNCPSTPLMAKFYLGCMREVRAQREAARAMQEGFDDLTSGNRTLTNVVSRLNAALEQAAPPSEPMMGSALSECLRKAVREVVEGSGLGEKLLTGIRPLDEALGGHLNGHMMIIGARPGVGKTTMAIQLTANAIEQGRPVVWFSREMSSSLLLVRLTECLSGVGLISREGPMSDRDASLVQGAMGKIEQSQIVMDDKTSDIEDIEAICHSMIPKLKLKTGKVPWVVADYAQKFRVKSMPMSDSNARLVCMRVSEGFKEISKELGCSTALLTQLNRSIETRKDPTPQMSDLKECGDLEQDASTIVLLSREGGSMVAHAVKSRFSMPRDARLECDMGCCRIGI